MMEREMDGSSRGCLRTRGCVLPCTIGPVDAIEALNESTPWLATAT